MGKDIIKKINTRTIKISKREVTKDFHDSKINYLVDHFNSVIKKNISEENLNLYYNNINNLTIKAHSKIDLNLIVNPCDGYYQVDKNILFVHDKNSIDSFNHEMLHMASSYFDLNDDYCYVGFSQNGKDFEIGISLNEGYTELLNTRFFNIEEETDYEYDVLIAFLVERIVGKDKMQKLYFNANLYDLVKELEVYSSRKETITFIKALDFIHNYIHYAILKNKEMATILLPKIEKYLKSTYVNKLNDDIKNNKISRDTAIEYYIEFCRVLNSANKYIPKEIKQYKPKIKIKEKIAL